MYTLCRAAAAMWPIRGAACGLSFPVKHAIPNPILDEPAIVFRYIPRVSARRCNWENRLGAANNRNLSFSLNAARMDFRTELCRRLSFNFEQAFALGDSLTSAKRSRLDLSTAHSHREVGNGCILGLSRAMRNYELPIRFSAHLDCLYRLGHRAFLIEFDERRVRRMFGNSALNELGIRNVDIIADDQNATAQRCRERALNSDRTALFRLLN
jgi:hypothetical protein